MFGLGLYNAYAGQIDVLGGTEVAFLVALFTRLFVGIGWYFLFKKADKNPVLAFVPLLGPYIAFRLVWDDFSMSCIFAGSTLLAFIDAVGVQQPVIHAFAIVNFDAELLSEIPIWEALLNVPFVSVTSLSTPI